MSDHTPQIIELQLSRGFVAIIDADDCDLAAFKWHCSESRGICYASRTTVENGKKYHIKLHRVIVARMVGRELLPVEKVDHIHGNGLDNRRKELRLASNAENLQNRGAQSNSKSGIKGVKWDKRYQKWRAEICSKGNHYHLGYFADIDDAAKAYREAAERLHGEFARVK